MKMKFAVLSTLFAFLLSGAAFAASTSKKLTVTDPIKVGNSTLQPGDYKVSWDGTGSQVNVNFTKNGKTVATVPATVQNTSNAQQAIQTTKEGNDNVVQKMSWSNLVLNFSQSGGGSSGSSSGSVQR